MSETVYTVDKIGDAGLVEALITRSLTEFIGMRAVQNWVHGLWLGQQI